MTDPVNQAPPQLDDDFIEIKDFTLKRKRIGFRIEKDTFEAHRVLGAPMIQQLVQLGRNIAKISDGADDDDENALQAKIETILSVFDKLLLPEAAVRFRERVKNNEVDVRDQLLPIVFYLMECYGLRPTQQSSDSSSGSPAETGGTSSTVGASSAASTSGG